eukprot:TRINITY_DN1621_c0_g2_i1.p1 TRINITY_DN1621_c0_g2~~TRINITY_DN1621_c0_g2_i1.p1  ORF type:complete len:768 (+),score=180.48 TRINITY_DN1621_c0_g2_i1:207-2510(+)
MEEEYWNYVEQSSRSETIGVYVPPPVVVTAPNDTTSAQVEVVVQQYSDSSSQHSGSPSDGSRNSGSFDEIFETSLADIDEDLILTLSSPEAEIEEILFSDISNKRAKHESQPDVAPSDRPLDPLTLQVTLFHKPRGCKGLYQRVETYDTLRVTRGKGKWLKMEVKTSIPIKSDDLAVYSLDLSAIPDGRIREEDRISNVTMQTYVLEGKNHISVELKLEKISKRIQFACVARTDMGELIGRTVEFASHDNGKAGHRESEKEKDGHHSSDSSPPMLADTPPNGSGSSPTDSSPPRGPAQIPPMLPHSERKRKVDEITSSFNYRTSSSPPQNSNGTSNGSILPNVGNGGPNVGNGGLNTGSTSSSASSTFVIDHSLRVEGFMRANKYIQFSDFNLKTNIEDLRDAVNIVSQLQGKTFTWKDGDLKNETGGRRVIGLIAQEVRKVVPEIVYEDERGVLSVAYAELVPLIIEAFKEQVATYETDKGNWNSQLEDLRSQLNRMFEEIATIENQNRILQEKKELLPSNRSSIADSSTTDSTNGSKTTHRRTWVRTGLIVTFLLGLSTLILGSILYGTTLSGPVQIVSVAIIQARHLRVPDNATFSIMNTFCEVQIGEAIHKTDVRWETNSPRFDVVLDFPEDHILNDTTDLIFRLWHTMPDSKSVERVGNARILFSSVKPREHLWMNLRYDVGSNYSQVVNADSEELDAEEGSVGELEADINIDTVRKASYEIGVMVGGAALVLGSMVGGYISLRKRKRRENDMPSLPPPLPA